MEFQRVRRTFHTATYFLLLTILVVAGPTDVRAAPRTDTKLSSTWIVRANPSKLQNGTPIFLEVTPPERLQSLKGNWLGHEIIFDQGSERTWFALAGTSLETKPGSYPLTLEAVTLGGRQSSFRKNFIVGHAKYPVIQLTVSKQFTEPSPGQLQVIKEDQGLKHKAFSVTTPEREWSGRFTAPVDAPTSDVFGTKRVFNGATNSVHQGLDYRVGPGTPVAAVNSGTVILAQPLYFEGNCVVLDHGQGLLSLYLHLSEIKVKEGERVARGQLLGLSGATGRATGPHLHIAVRWQGVYLNPAALLSLRLPESQAKNLAPAQ
jgi:murein DD-endopeptidase MepM/ murein hydrolase activator NlpD